MKLLQNQLFAILLLLSVLSCESIQTNEKKQPNFLIIMTDDMGFSDWGCYGGEIRTPHIDALAANGIRFTQMYNNARCCPSRASLLTGHYAHRVGLARNGRNLHKNAATLAEILLAKGYQTGMTGKWHLSETIAVKDKTEQLRWMAHQLDKGPFAPLETYPINRGFEEFWGVIWGVVNYFDPFTLVHNEDPIEEIPDDFYMTDFITDKSLKLIDKFSQKESPFFLYVAHTAPHWPLHALDEDIEKYRGIYDLGWEKLRQNRYQRMVDMGLIDSQTYPLPSNSSGQDWEEADQPMEISYMMAHAAMVDRVDQGIGKIIEKLKATGQFENTFLILLSDNGASPERGYPPGFDRPGFTRDSTMIEYNPPVAGPETTWAYLGSAWASAINTPFRFWKMESYEGGICTPFIVHWPEGLAGRENTINRNMAHVIDILPTCLELASVEYPSEINGLATKPPTGRSMMPLLLEEQQSIYDTLYWEHVGSRAIRIGNWKLSGAIKGDWELFNLENDHTETTDLSDKYPEKVEKMKALWETWTEENENLQDL